MAYGGSPAPAIATAMAMPTAEAVEAERPQCGGGGADQDNYDLPLHIIALFLVMGASIFGAGFPVVAKKVKWMKIPPNVFFFCKHFGTGVLIATAFVHLLPTAFQSLNDPCLPPLFTEQYPPMPGVIGMAALFVLFAIEMWLHRKTGGHDHGGATVESLNNAIHNPQMPRGPIQRAASFDSADSIDFEKAQMRVQYADLDNFPFPREYPSTDTKIAEIPSEMPVWFVAFYEQYVRQRDEMLSMIRRPADPLTALPGYSSQPPVQKLPVSALDQDPEDPPIDELTARRMALNITLLEGGILFHSVFVGMTVSITTDGFIILLIAILFHQTFEGLGLGSRIAAVPWKQAWRPWALVFAFGTTAPLGQFIGLVTRSSYDPDSAFALILVGTFNAISSGLLIYAALVDLLQQDFLSEESDRLLTHKKKMVAFAYVLMGAMGMSIVGAFA